MVSFITSKDFEKTESYNELVESNNPSILKLQYKWSFLRVINILENKFE